MLKKTITYHDFEGNELTEDFYFHFSDADLARMKLSVRGDFHEYMKAIVEVGDPKTIIDTFEEIIQKTIGARTPDGKGFMKSKELTEAFVATDAYSQLFMELITDAGKAAEFIRGVMPKKVQDKMPSAPAALEQAEAPKEPKKLADYTDQELLDMPWAEFNALLKGIPGNNIPKEILLIAMKKKPDTQ